MYAVRGATVSPHEVDLVYHYIIIVCKLQKAESCEFRPTYRDLSANIGWLSKPAFSDVLSATA
jgi:hypothetical protein